MPYKSQKIKIAGTEYDRRQKLTPEQKTEICKIYATGSVSQRILAEQFGVSKSLIGLIVNPERQKKVQERLKRARLLKLYTYNKRDWAAAIKEHRRYKQSLYKSGKIKINENNE